MFFLNNDEIKVQCLKIFQFRDLLEKVALDMHFTFDGSIYKQIYGVAMDSPFGPTLANTLNDIFYVPYGGEMDV